MTWHPHIFQSFFILTVLSVLSCFNYSADRFLILDLESLVPEPLVMLHLVFRTYNPFTFISWTPWHSSKPLFFHPHMKHCFTCVIIILFLEFKNSTSIVVVVNFGLKHDPDPFLICFWVASSCNALITFSHQELIDIGLSMNPDFMSDWTDSIPPEIVRLWVIVGNSKQLRLLRQRKQKRRCRACYRVELQKQQNKPLFPSIFFTNGKSLANKIEELQSEI